MSPTIHSVFSISPDGNSEAYFNNVTSDAQLIKGVLPQPQRGTVAAYSVGGKIEFPISAGSFNNHIEKYPFSIDGASATDVGEISKTFTYHTPFQSATDAYMFEGYTDMPLEPHFFKTGVEKFPFSVPVATSSTLSYSDMGLPTPGPAASSGGRIRVVSETSKAYFITNISNHVTNLGSSLPFANYSIFNTDFTPGITTNQIAYKFPFSTENISAIPGTHTVLYSSNSATVDTTGGPTPFGNEGNPEGSFALNGGAWIGDSDVYFSGDASMQQMGTLPTISNMYGYITKMPIASEAFSVATTQVVTRDMGGDPTANPDGHPVSLFTNWDVLYNQTNASGPTAGYYITPTPSTSSPKSWMKWPYSNFATSSDVAEFGTGRRFGMSCSTSETDVFTTGGRADPTPFPNRTFDTIEKFPFSQTTGTMTDVGELINTLYFAGTSVD